MYFKLFNNLLTKLSYGGLTQANQEYFENAKMNEKAEGYKTFIYNNFSSSSYAAFCDAYSALQNSKSDCLTTFPPYFKIITEHENYYRPFIIVMQKNEQTTGMIVGRILKQPVNMRIGNFLILTPVRNCLIVSENGFIVKDDSPEHCKALLEAMYCNLSSNTFTVINLLWIPLDSVVYRLSRKWVFRDYFPIMDKHWFTDLEKPFESMLMQRSRKHRGNLKRTIKKIEGIEKDKFRLREFRSSNDVADLINDAEHIAMNSYQRAWGVGFVKNKSIEEALLASAKEGGLLSYILYAYDKPCAFQIGIIHAGTYYIPFLSHDSCYSYYDPGTYLLVKSIIAACAIEDVTTIDYGWSDNFLKQRFGNRCRYEANLSFFAPTFDGLLMCIGKSITTFITKAFKSLIVFLKLDKEWNKLKTRRSKLRRVSDP